MAAMSPVTATSPEVAAMVRDRIMKLSGVERFVIAARMFESARAIVLASFPSNISETEREANAVCAFLPRAISRTAAEEFQKVML
jgi:hypothetical protein